MFLKSNPPQVMIIDSHLESYLVPPENSKSMEIDEDSIIDDDLEGLEFSSMHSSSSSVTSSIRSVAFAPQVSIHLVEDISEWTPDEIRNTWYTHEELREVQRSAVRTLRKVLATGKDLTTEEKATETTRGLEHVLPRSSRTVKRHRQAHIRAVLDEQEAQRFLQNHEQLSWECVAKACGSFGDRSTRRALALAARDAEEAR